MDLQEKKDTVINMLSLHPSSGWYRQCLEIHCTAEEIALLEQDPSFLREVQMTLFMQKQVIMEKRNRSIELAGKMGRWQGYDKLLQEIDQKLFSVGKDIGDIDDKDVKTEIYLPDNGRGMNDT